MLNVLHTVGCKEQSWKVQAQRNGLYPTWGPQGTPGQGQGWTEKFNAQPQTCVFMHYYNLSVSLWLVKQ